MDIYTEDEKSYHMDLIEDAIEVYEHRKSRLNFSTDEHIDLIIKFNEHAESLSSTKDIVSVTKYKMLYNESAKLAKRMASIYEKQREFNFTDYYNFCKIVSQMMEILFNETDDGIADIFSKMKM